MGSRRFVPTKATGKRSICTIHGTKHLFEGMKDRSNLFHFFFFRTSETEYCNATQSFSSPALRFIIHDESDNSWGDRENGNGERWEIDKSDF